MTKLMQWLLALGLFGSVYMAFITKQVKHKFLDDNELLIQLSPLLLLVIFGIYSIFIVLYRTFTFNDCQAAAMELQKEIQEAKKDLSKKGYKFD